MTKEYNSNYKSEYTAPKAPRIVKPEPSLPKWMKNPILYSILAAYLGINFGGFILAHMYRDEKMSRSEIEEKIDKDYSNKGDLIKFVFDDLPKPGRELAYRIHGDGEKEK